MEQGMVIHPSCFFLLGSFGIIPYAIFSDGWCGLFGVGIGKPIDAEWTSGDGPR